MLINANWSTILLFSYYTSPAIMYELASGRNQAVYFSEEEAHESVGINMSNSTRICEDLHLRKFCQGPPSRENICLLSYS